MNATLRWMGVLIAGCVLFAGGCGSSMKKFEVRVTPTAGVTDDRRLEVDVLALGGANAGRVEAYSKLDYFRPNDPTRDSLTRKKTLVWAPGESDTKTVELRDPIWTDWGKAERLFILANVAGAPGTSRAALENLRMAVLPRDSKRWGGTKELDVTISDGGITVYPEPGAAE